MSEGPRRLVMMADHDADPLWEDADGAMAQLESLPLRESTVAALRAWRRRWEGLALAKDHEEPEWSALESEGRRLWMSIREQLGDRFEVGYALTVEGVDRVQVQWSPDAEPEPPGWFGGRGVPRRLRDGRRRIRAC